MRLRIFDKAKSLMRPVGCSNPVISTPKLATKFSFERLESRGKGVPCFEISLSWCHRALYAPS